MAVFYNEGEAKTRPGVYQRYTNVGQAATPGAKDGICAIPVRSFWGPVGQVVRNSGIKELERNYGTGDYSSNYTIPAAMQLFKGGAATVYTYRVGKDGTGTAASKILDTYITVTAKYPGAVTMAVSIQVKLGDSSTKIFSVYFDSELVESWEFAADGEVESTNLINATANSAYVVITASTTVAEVSAVSVANGALSGGVNPTIENAGYSAAYSAFEPYYYNTICLDIDDDASLTLSKLLQTYLDEAYRKGKLGIAVVGEKTTVAFASRLSHAKAFNDEKVVYLGGGWKAGTENLDGALAIAYTAGVVASTAANRGITHTIIQGATELLESLTYAQYEDAINAGMLMPSMSPDGLIWYDSAIDTLTHPDASTQDDGWKKIRRVKVRFELFDRLDRALAPKVGKVSADTDGIADVVQTGMRVLNAMTIEGKIRPGAVFIEDPERPYEGDSAWFIIQADDIDSLEKIYLQYQFRYSQVA